MTEGHRVFVIAEAGVNHNGSLETARRLIDVAREAGADAVKFQTFRAERLVTASAPKADYQRRSTNATESQYSMVRSLELDEDAHHALIDHCGRVGIQFMSTPFDEKSVELLAKTFDLPMLKIGSGDITNGPLLLCAARTGKRLILSTGMSTLGDIEAALGILAFGYTGRDQPSERAFRAAYADSEGRRSLLGRVVLLHCTTEYPAPFDEVNLRAMDAMRSAFGLPVGLSDHTPGIAVPIAAAALGADVLEKHFTLDRGLPGPDHKASLEPAELAAMIAGIRQVEEALGDPAKVPTRSEWKNARIARRSLTALCSIRAGESLTRENLGTKRPGDGVLPMLYWEYLGRTARRDYLEDEQVDPA